MEELCKEGAKVAFSGISDIGVSTCAELQAQGFNVLFCQGDMADAAFCTSLVDRTVAAFGKINHLVNNAFSFTAKGMDATREDWERVFFVGPVGYATMTQLRDAASHCTGGRVHRLHVERLGLHRPTEPLDL